MNVTRIFNFIPFHSNLEFVELCDLVDVSFKENYCRLSRRKERGALWIHTYCPNNNGMAST
jgi:hypothetical protein